MSRPSVSMLGWALNEEESIAAYVEKAEIFLRGVANDFELVFIDDGSTDSTTKVARGLAESRPWLKIFPNDRNRGSGYNTKRAITLATKDVLFWQTVDWAYDISHLAECFPLIEKYDVLQGVRVNSLSWRSFLRTRSDSPYKGVVSIVNYLLVRTLFRLPFHDYQNVTVYRRSLIQSVELESESAFTNPECLLKTWWKGASFKEVPVKFLPRQKGKGKGTRIPVILRSVRDIFQWWLRWVVLGKRTDKGRGSVSYFHESA